MVSYALVCRMPEKCIGITMVTEGKDLVSLVNRLIANLKCMLTSATKPDHHFLYSYFGTREVVLMKSLLEGGGEQFYLLVPISSFKRNSRIRDIEITLELLVVT